MSKWIRNTLIAGVVLAALLLLPFLIPTGAYLGQIEKVASDKLGVPVSVRALRVAFLPSPRLNVSGINIGKNNEISVAEVAIVPAIMSLLSDTKIISSVQVENPVIKKSALDILAALPKQPDTASSASTVSVRHIVIKDARLEWPGMNLPEMNADITLSDANKPESAEIESVDGKLKIILTPKGQQQSIVLSAENWIVPIGPPLLIDRLKSEMTLFEKKLEISQIEASLYQGKVNGNATLAWDKNWHTAGKLKVEGLSVREPASLMSKSTKISGSLFGNGSFNAKAKEASQLTERLNADFRFKVENGVLYGFDLAKAPMMLLGKGQGGETKFDVFSGLLNVTGRQYQLSDLKVSSGLIAAQGAVKINPRKELDGVVKVEVKSSSSLTEIPLQISGTLDHPVVLPTKAAMAGAVAGTAVLGPGAGTSLGVKAGSALDKVKGLFGGK